MSDLLARIDEITGLCPCGAPPRNGSAYCSYDCEPTHIARDTDTRETGELATAMRWRPDLVNHADDANLRLLENRDPRIGYRGSYNAEVFERLDRTGVWHLRLNDGHRYVGLDVTVEIVDGIIDLTSGTQILKIWAKLERELTNTRHIEPEPDPWADFLHTSREQITVTDAVPPVAGFVWHRQCSRCGTHTIPLDGVRPIRTPVPAYLAGEDSPMEFTREDCHLCRQCRAPLPGPRLTLSSRAYQTLWGISVEVTLAGGGRHLTGSLPSHTDDQAAQSYLDAMERELVRNLAAERVCQASPTADSRGALRTAWIM